MSVGALDNKSVGTQSSLSSTGLWNSLKPCYDEEQVVLFMVMEVVKYAGAGWVEVGKLMYVEFLSFIYISSECKQCWKDL